LNPSHPVAFNDGFHYFTHQLKENLQESINQLKSVGDAAIDIAAHVAAHQLPPPPTQGFIKHLTSQAVEEAKREVIRLNIDLNYNRPRVVGEALANLLTNELNKGLGALAAVFIPVARKIPGNLGAIREVRGVAYGIARMTQLGYTYKGALQNKSGHGLDAVFTKKLLDGTIEYATLEAKHGARLNRLEKYFGSEASKVTGQKVVQGTLEYSITRARRYLQNAKPGDKEGIALAKALLDAAQQGRLRTFVSLKRGGKLYEIPVGYRRKGTKGWKAPGARLIPGTARNVTQLQVTGTLRRGPAHPAPEGQQSYPPTNTSAAATPQTTLADILFTYYWLTGQFGVSPGSGISATPGVLPGLSGVTGFLMPGSYLTPDLFAQLNTTAELLPPGGDASPEVDYIDAASAFA
jgi:hypothetical protein